MGTCSARAARTGHEGCAEHARHTSVWWAHTLCACVCVCVCACVRVCARGWVGGSSEGHLVGVDAKVGEGAVVPRVAGVGHHALAAAQPGEDERAVGERRETEGHVHLLQLREDHLEAARRGRRVRHGEGVEGEQPAPPVVGVVVRGRVHPQPLLTEDGDLALAVLAVRKDGVQAVRARAEALAPPAHHVIAEGGRELHHGEHAHRQPPAVDAHEPRVLRVVPQPQLQHLLVDGLLVPLGELPQPTPRRPLGGRLVAVAKEHPTQQTPAAQLAATGAPLVEPAGTRRQLDPSGPRPADRVAVAVEGHAAAADGHDEAADQLLERDE